MDFFRVHIRESNINYGWPTDQKNCPLSEEWLFTPFSTQDIKNVPTFPRNTPHKIIYTWINYCISWSPVLSSRTKRMVTLIKNFWVAVKKMHPRRMITCYKKRWCNHVEIHNEAKTLHFWAEKSLNMKVKKKYTQQTLTITHVKSVTST